MSKALLFMALALPLLACIALPAALAAPTATRLPRPSRTAKPTWPPTSSPSTTPEPVETPTEYPSATPEPMLSLTPTISYRLPTLTPTVQSELDCKLLWKSPGDGISYKWRDRFTVGWNVRNTGTAAWDPASVEFTYVGGAKLYEYPLVHLESSVAPGQEVVLSAAMKAPKNSTLYTTYWSLRQGNTFFCRLTESIYVK
jgi:hypothetical protein